MIFDLKPISQLLNDLSLQLNRGTKAVVIGDEKQLRPFDLFRLKDAGDDGKQISLLQEEDRITFHSESLLMLSRGSLTIMPI